jgi:adenosylcobinamide-GDP ribazoletransferase
MRTAFNFLTILPWFHHETSLPALGRAVGWFPLVGLAIGALLAGFDWILSQFLPAGPVAVLVLALWLVASGGIHFDGLLDSCDGLFGGKTAAQRLEIMRDHRVGAFAVAGGGLMLLLKASTLAAMPQRWQALLLAPTLGRWSIALAIVRFPYARKQGLGRAMKDYARNSDALLATSITLLAAWGVAGLNGMMALVGAGLLLWLTATFIQRRIPGLTGDSYGALNELIEALTLLILLATLTGGDYF